MENRYDKYKDSDIAWIGEIPEHWELRKGKNLFKLRNSKGNNNAILLAATQKYGMIPQSQVEGVVQVKQNTDLNTFKTVHKNDYVISLRSFQGGFEMSEYEGVCSPAYQVFYSTKPCCNYFFKYMFKSYGFVSQINAFTLGIREGKNIQYEDFSLMKLPLPTIQEQQSIATYLDQKCGEIDKLITLQEEMITKLQSYKQSVITEAVTKSLNKNVPLKDSGIEWIGEIPEHWDNTRIKNNYNVILGKMVERNNDSSSGGENYLCAANIKWNGVDTEINKKMYFSDVEKEKYLLQYNDVLIMEGGMAGTTCLYKNEFSPCYVQNSVNVCRAKKDFNNKFLYYWMYVPYYNGYIDTICNKATIKHYTKEKVQNTPILVPPLHEQQSIADYLDQKCSEIDELISIKQQKIEKLKDYKKSLIFECVTGKRKVS